MVVDLYSPSVPQLMTDPKSQNPGEKRESEES